MMSLMWRRATRARYMSIAKAGQVGWVKSLDGFAPKPRVRVLYFFTSFENSLK